MKKSKNRRVREPQERIKSENQYSIENSEAFLEKIEKKLIDLNLISKDKYKYLGREVLELKDVVPITKLDEDFHVRGITAEEDNIKRLRESFMSDERPFEYGIDFKQPVPMVVRTKKDDFYHYTVITGNHRYEALVELNFSNYIFDVIELDRFTSEGGILWTSIANKGQVYLPHSTPTYRETVDSIVRCVKRCEVEYLFKDDSNKTKAYQFIQLQRPTANLQTAKTLYLRISDKLFKSNGKTLNMFRSLSGTAMADGARKAGLPVKVNKKGIHEQGANNLWLVPHDMAGHHIHYKALLRMAKSLREGISIDDIDPITFVFRINSSESLSKDSVTLKRVNATFRGAFEKGIYNEFAYEANGQHEKLFDKIILGGFLPQSQGENSKELIRFDINEKQSTLPGKEAMENSMFTMVEFKNKHDLNVSSEKMEAEILKITQGGARTHTIKSELAKIDPSFVQGDQFRNLQQSMKRRGQLDHSGLYNAKWYAT